MFMNKKTLNSGVVKIYSISDCGLDGGRPVEKLTLKETLRFHRRTVGMTRYYTAMQANQQVDAVLRCYLRPSVSTQDIAILGGKQYRITLVQVPEDVVPPVMDLTLTRLEQDYELKDA